MSNPLAKLREECQRQLTVATEAAYPGVALPESKFSQPPDPKMGELASAASFQLAKTLRQKPADIAINIAKHVKHHGLVASAEAVNGYINFHADEGNYYKLVFETAAADPEYGYLKVEKPQKIMVEHTSANPIHPITIGHARNAITGACLANMLRLRGNHILRRLPSQRHGPPSSPSHLGLDAPRQTRARPRHPRRDIHRQHLRLHKRQHGAPARRKGDEGRPRRRATSP